MVDVRPDRSGTPEEEFWTIVRGLPSPQFPSLAAASTTIFFVSSLIASNLLIVLVPTLPTNYCF